MPKFIGRTIPGSRELPEGARALRLSYSQAIKLPATEVYRILDTSDRGGKGSYAKRWYRWYASPEAILSYLPVAPMDRRVELGIVPP